MATTEKLQNEILLKEEAFLKEEKAKLTEQLNKLKVEEMALMKLLKPDNEPSHHTTLELFAKKPQLASASTQRVNEFETETEVNHIPLQALDNLDMNRHSAEREEEEFEDDDEDDTIDYSQQLLNAMSHLNQQNSNMDQDNSRSVFHSIMQQEIDDFNEEEDEYFS